MAAKFYAVWKKLVRCRLKIQIGALPSWEGRERVRQAMMDVVTKWCTRNKG